MLKQRIGEHKSSIRRNDFSHPVSSLRFQGAEHMELRRWRDMERKICRRELFWIVTLKTLQPMGLNEDFDMSNML